MAAAYTDQAYADAGAMIVPDAASAVSAADILFKIQRPMSADGGRRRVRPAAPGPGADGAARRAHQSELVQALAATGVTSFALEPIPRITRAQSMDVLCSQANLAGYKAVMVAADKYGRFFPMMMTPAGTLQPARVVIMGVGVAGLQAIATARRLGAVTATDVRPAIKEQVAVARRQVRRRRGRGVKAAETAGGYAKQMSAE